MQNSKTQAQIKARLVRITENEHFGEAKNLGNKLAELKWKNGLRVYFSLSHDGIGSIIIVLIAGNKNTQKKDITIARKILSNMSFKD